MVGRYCIVGWKFNLVNLVLKVSIYTAWCTRQVTGAQKNPICVKYIEKSYQLIFPLFPTCENILEIYLAT